MSTNCRIITKSGKELRLDRVNKWVDSEVNDVYVGDLMSKSQLELLINNGLDLHEGYYFFILALGFIAAFDEGESFLILTEHKDEFNTFDYPEQKQRVIKEFSYYS